MALPNVYDIEAQSPAMNQSAITANNTYNQATSQYNTGLQDYRGRVEGKGENISPEAKKLKEQIRAIERWLYAYNKNPAYFRVQFADENYFTPRWGFSYIRAKQLYDIFNDTGRNSDGLAFYNYVVNKSGTGGDLLKQQGFSQSGVPFSVTSEMTNHLWSLIYPVTQSSESEVDAYKTKLETDLPTKQQQLEEQIQKDTAYYSPAGDMTNINSTYGVAATNAIGQYNQLKFQRERALGAVRSGRMMNRLTDNPYKIL